MSEENLIASAMDILLEANKLLKKQAEERHIIYQKFMRASARRTASPNDVLSKRLEIEMEKPESSNFFKMQKLEYLNMMIEQIDQKEKHRDELLEEIKHQEVNRQSRDELISILEEYIDIEEASIYRLVENYAEAEEILQKSKQEGEMFELLSTNDPRVRALEAIQKHEEGMSVVQLSFMLGTTQYQATKIINELLEMGMIVRKGRLLKYSKSQLGLEEKTPLNLTV